MNTLFRCLLAIGLIVLVWMDCKWALCICLVLIFTGSELSGLVMHNLHERLKKLEGK